LTVVDGGWPEFQRGMAERRERGGKRGMEMDGRKEAQEGSKMGTDGAPQSFENSRGLRWKIDHGIHRIHGRETRQSTVPEHVLRRMVCRTDWL